MRILTIGGGRFSGRALTGLASDAGHDVTMFHRGSGPDDPWPEVEHVHGDRAEGFGALAGRPFDAVLDFCGFYPRQVREAADAFPDAGRYLFISSISAHTEGFRAGVTEDQDLFEPPFPDTEEITWDTYGPLKVASEREVSAAYGERATVVRPGYIVGPARPDRPVHVLGAPGRARRAHGRARAAGPARCSGSTRATWPRSCCTSSRPTRPGRSAPSTAPGGYTLDDVLRAVGRRRGRRDDRGVGGRGVRRGARARRDRGRDRPVPDDHARGAPRARGVGRARASPRGCTTRTLEETVRDTLAWDDERGAPWPMSAGLTPEREAELLAAVDSA